MFDLNKNLQDCFALVNEKKLILYIFQTICKLNNTNFLIEMIRVKIEYVKDASLASGAVYKTEYIDFENIKPHETRVLRAPDSDRGTSIRTSIFTVKSKALEALLQ